MAAWDFSVGISTRDVRDTSSNQLHGKTVQMPTRAVTGHNWTGADTNFRLAPRQYGAIYFHDDDLDDAGWEVDFEFRVPANLRSGVYAARLQSGTAEDYIPFYGDYGAGGFEIDRLDHRLGTPPHALLLATASGYSDVYQHVVEEVMQADSMQSGSVNPWVRSDMVYFEHPNGGAVFSVGSIAWDASLSYNRYDNNVSRITENVLTKFASDEWFPEDNSN